MGITWNITHEIDNCQSTTTSLPCDSFLGEAFNLNVGGGRYLATAPNYSATGDVTNLVSRGLELVKMEGALAPGFDIDDVAYNSRTPRYLFDTESWLYSHTRVVEEEAFSIQLWGIDPSVQSGRVGPEVAVPGNSTIALLVLGAVALLITRMTAKERRVGWI